MDSEFVAEFARRLHERSHEMSLPLLWLEERLAERHVTIEQLMQSEGQQSAADQVSIGNSVSSLRFLAAMDWHIFVESLSCRTDPCGYPADDFDAGQYQHRDTAESDRISKDTRTFTAKWISQHAIIIVTLSSASLSRVGWRNGKLRRKPFN